MCWCLMFFTVCGCGLWFGFWLKIVLIIITERCLHIIKTLSASHNRPPVRGMGMCKKLWGDTARGADQNWPQGYLIAFGILLNIYIWGKKVEMEGPLEWWHLSSQATALCDESFSGNGWIPAFPTGSSELIPCFVLLMCTPLTLLINCLHLSPWFSHFCHSDFLPIRNCHSSQYIKFQKIPVVIQMLRNRPILSLVNNFLIFLKLLLLLFIPYVNWKSLYGDLNIQGILISHHSTLIYMSIISPLKHLSYDLSSLLIIRDFWKESFMLSPFIFTRTATELLLTL